MRLEVSEPTIVDTLVESLRALDCVAKRDGQDAIEIELPQTGEPWHPENQAVVELTFLVRAWLRVHPDVKFRIVDDQASQSAKRA